MDILALIDKTERLPSRIPLRRIGYKALADGNGDTYSRM